MSGNQIVNIYLSLESALHEYFGYKEDWVKIPIEDRRQYYWMLQQEDSGKGTVTFFEEPLTVDLLFAGDCYTDTIYTQRFLPRWVYPGKDLTMIAVDTHTDGNKFLAIYDNKKRVKASRELVEANSRWRYLYD